MDRSFHSLCNMKPGKEAWRIKARVVRIWKVPTFINPQVANSLEMVLVDEKGGKIHATVRKQLLYLFQDKVVEGEVYIMSYFVVVPNTGAYKTSSHSFKLVFLMRTKVQKTESSMIPIYGLSLLDAAGVNSHRQDSDVLVDVIGLMTGISAEREYIRDGKVTKLVILELTDFSGEIECALFAEYVDQFQKLWGKGADAMPIVVLQFAKIKIFRDNVGLLNVMNTTRILVNPQIPEVAKFKKGLVVHGIDSQLPVSTIYVMRNKVSVEEDFLLMHPKKTLAQLNDSVEDGIFVVLATMVGIVEGGDWW